jgi:hypothetical protein
VIGFLRRHHREPVDPDEGTRARRERLAIFSVAGGSLAFEPRVRAETRLLFARDLRETGRINEDGGRDDR